MGETAAAVLDEIKTPARDERQHARRVRPVLERRWPARVPVRPLDLVPADRAEPRVRNQLVRPREHADRVKLHSRDPPQHPGDAAPPPVGAEKPLGEEGKPPRLVRSQLPVVPGWGVNVIPNGRGCLSHATDSSDGV